MRKIYRVKLSELKKVIREDEDWPKEREGESDYDIALDDLIRTTRFLQKNYPMQMFKDKTDKLKKALQILEDLMVEIKDD